MLGSIIERSAPSSSSAPVSFIPSPPSASGFPKAQHRSAFKKSLARPAQPRTAAPPSLGPTPAQATQTAQQFDNDDDHLDETAKILRSVQRENEDKLASMSSEEIQQKKEELLERFGGGLLDQFRKRREQRQRSSEQASSSASPQASTSTLPPPSLEQDETSRIIQSIQKENDERILAMSHEERMAEKQELLDKFGGGLLGVLKKRREARESEESRGATRAEEEVVFGEVVEDALSSSRSRVRFAPVVEDALPPAPAPIAKPFTFPFSPVPQPPPTSNTTSAVDEDTPESIRSRYFASDTSFSASKLEWMQPTDASFSSSDETRYSLEGTAISSSLSELLPTHLGLHHHGDAPSQAGYTLAEVIHLSLSTSPAQRSGMLGVLAKIVRNDDGMEKGLRGKAMEVAGRAVDERGGGMMVVVRGIEVVHEVLVGGLQWRERKPRDLGMEIVGDQRDSSALESRAQEAEDDEDILASLHLPSLVPILLIHLAAPSFPSSTTHSLLSILLLFSLLPSHQSCLLLLPSPPNPSPLLPTLTRNLLTLSADPTNLLVVNSLIISSRTTALEILNSPISPLPALLKYVAAVLPTQQGRELAKGAMDIYASLARYGLGASLCSDASDVWRGLGAEMASGLRSLSDEEAFVELATSYYRLLTTWTVCAIDPHKTSPEHEITWSQIVGMGWAEDGLDALVALLPVLGASGGEGRREKREDLATVVLEFVEVWVEGARVNEPKGGEEFRLQLGEKLVEVEHVLETLVGRLHALVTKAASSRDWDEIGKLARSVDGLVKLVLSSDSAGLALPTIGLKNLFDVLLKLNVWDTLALEIFPPTPSRALPRPSNPYSHIRPITSLLATILALPSLIFTPTDRLANILELLLVLLPGDEPLARSLVQSIFTLDFSSLFTSLNISPLFKGLTHRYGLAILEPFFYFLVSPQEDNHVAPLVPTPSSLPLVTTLRLPSTSNLPLVSPSASPEHHRSLRGLPLRRSWLFEPLTELLHSSSSQAFASAPPDWDASETELVQATLAFSAVVQASSVGGRAMMGASEMVLELLNVFLLEKGVPTVVEGADGRVLDTSGSEVFRDPHVERLISALLQPFLASNITSSQSPTPSPNSPSTLDQAHSLANPTSRTPFFSTYTDFLALYTSISFSHPLFALLLLPPLASSTYAPDYRKLFWAEETLPLLRGITVRVKDVVVEPATGLKGFLQPRERDGDLLGAYLRAVVGAGGGGQGGWVTKERNEFLYWVAVGHLASAIWSEGEAETGEKLMRVVLAKGSEGLVRDVVGYRQPEKGEEGEELWGDASEEEVKGRVEKVGKWAGERGVERVRALGLGMGVGV